MKKTQKILGLPIISISDGVEVGKVKSIIINSDKGAIDYIVVDSGIQIFSARVIPTEDVLGIGEYALTIENEGVITDISRIPEAIQLLQNDIRVKGTKVLTKKGSLIGEIGDIYIDENDNCKITGLEFIADITDKKIRIIPRDSVITFGKNLTIVKEDVEASLLDTPAQLGKDSDFDEIEKKNNLNINEYQNIGFTDTETSDDVHMPPFTEKIEEVSAYVEEADQKSPEEASIPENTQDLFSKQPEAEVSINTGNIFSGSSQDNLSVVEETSSGEKTANEKDNASILFEQRQRQYLKGRYATRTITDNMGNVIIGEGMQIDDAVIDEAKAKGKMIELVMNNRA